MKHTPSLDHKFSFFPMCLELTELQKNFTSVSEILIMHNLISSYRFFHILKWMIKWPNKILT